ncbi:PadR family transcriptional regulator [Paenibacillus psychroresistens]|uniref:PadR family transcriptional regulator n=2 Tax=Paenibacillus psychroresistens TaxID=1778678 RepID=A0A6B8RW22_9BACL|nr:PadR family transcriptional regulator [Paenibacillus psychroresistens]
MLPLTEGFYYILICLIQAPAHGYGIMQDVEKMTLGRVRIGPGTLYTALNTLLKKELIIDLPTTDSADSRRKMYAITENGKKTVAGEIQRLQELLDNGRKSMNTGEE